MMINLLFIDDDSEFHRQFERSFHSKMPTEKYNLMMAYSGSDALNMMRMNSGVDIVLCDINMPSMDGITFLTELRKIDQQTKVIMLSAAQSMATIRKLMREEAADFIMKPIDFDDLEVTLNRTFQLIRHQRELKRVQEESILQMKEGLEQSIHLVTTIGEMRDPYTAGHQFRVGELAQAISKELKCSEEQSHWIYVSGLLHDIGKICIPTEILCRPGGVSPHEMDLIQDHANAGYEILRQINFPWNVADIVRQHHERLDGSGYPRALTENQILIESKIISVADTVESVFSFRPYRPGLGIEKALEVIQNERGRLYDANVVDACLNLFLDKGFQFGKNIKFSTESLRELRANHAANQVGRATKNVA